MTLCRHFVFADDRVQANLGYLVAKLLKKAVVRPWFCMLIGGPMKRILLIDDDRDWLGVAGKLLIRGNYDVQVLDSGKMVIPTIMAKPPDVVITDIKMPGISGSQVHGLIRSHIGPQLPII